MIGKSSSAFTIKPSITTPNKNIHPRGNDDFFAISINVLFIKYKAAKILFYS